MKTITASRIILFILCLSSFFLAPSAYPQQSDDILLTGNTPTMKYLLELSGTVLNETFTGAKASLTFSHHLPDSQNQYLFIIGGFPDEQSQNSFFWNSEEGDMEVYSNEITCSIAQSPLKNPNIYFYYLSPALYEKPTLFYTHKEKENRDKAKKTSIPTKIFAQAGKLKLTINPQSVSGTIWLKGYDPIEKSYVLYNATFFGKSALRVEQTKQGKSK